MEWASFSIEEVSRNFVIESNCGQKVRERVN